LQPLQQHLRTVQMLFQSGQQAQTVNQCQCVTHPQQQTACQDATEQLAEPGEQDGWNKQCQGEQSQACQQYGVACGVADVEEHFTCCHQEQQPALDQQHTDCRADLQAATVSQQAGPDQDCAQKHRAEDAAEDCQCRDDKQVLQAVQRTRQLVKDP